MNASIAMLWIIFCVLLNGLAKYVHSFLYEEHFNPIFCYYNDKKIKSRAGKHLIQCMKRENFKALKTENESIDETCTLRYSKF